MLRLLTEAFIVGISTIIAGTAITYFLKNIFTNGLPPVCKDWNKHYAMEISLFLTGFLLHLFFEVVGLNRWYCKFGNACRK